MGGIPLIITKETMKYYPIYRAKITGEIWTTDSVAQSAEEAEACGLSAEKEMEMHQFIGVTTNFECYLAGYMAAQKHKAD